MTFTKRTEHAAEEADGLRWLGEVVRVPRVIAVGATHIELERIEGRRGANFDETLGRELAKLHRAGAPSFGYQRDNFIAVLPQDNSPESDWATFYRKRRLQPLAGRDLSALRIEFPEEPPARLHGDLWNGNVLAASDGLPVFIDPAVYGGHREMDLAMMRLFGGFSQRTFAAYAEVYPLAPGHEQRIALAQLYPLLVHAKLFGGGYVRQASEIIERYS